MKHFRKYKNWQLTDPEVEALFSGLYISAKNFHFRTDENGNHVRDLIGLKLIALGMTRTASTKLIGAAIEKGLIQRGEYIQPKKEPSLSTRISLDDPRVQSVLAGVTKCGTRTYYKNGEMFPLRRELGKALSASKSTAAKILKLAEAAKMIPVALKAEKPVPKPLAASVAASEPEPLAADTQDQEGYVFADEDKDEPQDEAAAPLSFAICRKQLPSRYSLVISKSRTRTFYGVADSKYDSQWILSEDRAVALAEVKRLNGEDKAKEKLPYYKKAA